jgi:hypothetical protein
MLRSKLSFQTDLQNAFSAIQELQDGEEGLARYNLDVAKKLFFGLGLASDIHRSHLMVVEFGAGTGTLAEVWRDQFAIDPFCIEIDPDLLSILRSKGFKTNSSIKNLPAEISYIYTSNVLEHIEDDVLALSVIRRKMEIGGRIAIYVPALPFLFSDLDRHVGHFRRYKKRELVRKVKLAGFEVEKCYYNDCIGVLASILLKILGFRNKTGLGSKKSLLFYDQYVFPVSKILDRLIFRYLIGKNLFLFATNPTK